VSLGLEVMKGTAEKLRKSVEKQETFKENQSFQDIDAPNHTPIVEKEWSIRTQDFQ